MSGLNRFRNAVHDVKKRISVKKVNKESMIEKAVHAMQSKKQAKVDKSSRECALDEYVALLTELEQSLDDQRHALQGKDALTAATRAMERLEAWDAQGRAMSEGFAATARRVAVVQRLADVGARCPAWKTPALEKRLASLQAGTASEAGAVAKAQQAEQAAAQQAYEEKVKDLSAIERARLNLGEKKQQKQTSEAQGEVLERLLALLAELERSLQTDATGLAAMNAASKVMDRLEAWDAEFERGNTLRNQPGYPTEQRQRLVAQIVSVGARCPAWNFKGNGCAERVRKLGGATEADACSAVNIESILLEVEASLTRRTDAWGAPCELKGIAALRAVKLANSKLQAMDSACGACLEKEQHHPDFARILAKRAEVEALIKQISSSI